jgi:hypothetical protein
MCKLYYDQTRNSVWIFEIIIIQDIQDSDESTDPQGYSHGVF